MGLEVPKDNHENYAQKYIKAVNHSVLNEFDARFGVE